MADVFSKAKRSEVMSRIRGRGNKSTELRLIEIFRVGQRIGWRRGSKLPGRPDFVFLNLKLAVFVDGCFWHGCARCYERPKTNQGFWDKKLIENRNRDKKVARNLKKMGWKVIRIWEHELRSPSRILARLGHV